MMKAGELKFEYTMIDLFLVLKSNLGFILSQRLSIYNHVGGSNGIGGLEFQSAYHVGMTDVSMTTGSIFCQRLFTEHQLSIK